MAWLTGFSYRKSHVVNAATGAGTNYQIPIIVNPGVGADSGDTIYLNSKANYFPNDVAFAGSDGATELSYWRENDNTFWVKIADSLESVNRTIYIYYGKAIKDNPIDFDNYTLERYASNPVIALGASGQWDDYWIGIRSIVLSGSTYYMYYHAWRSSTQSKIGLATSSDGISWTKNGGNPIFDVGAALTWDDKAVSCPAVWIEGATWYMLYSGTNVATGKSQMGLATSTDGISWTKSGSNPVMSFGGVGTWDLQAIGVGSILKDGSTYYVYYTGWNDVNATNQKIGGASSTDLISWTKFAGNPILDVTASSWEQSQVLDPFVLKFGSTYYMYYQGNDISISPARSRIGLATNSSPDTTFSKSSSNPIFQSPSINHVTDLWDSIWNEAPLFIDFGTHWRMYYGGNNNTLPGTLRYEGYAIYKKKSKDSFTFLLFDDFNSLVVDTGKWTNTDTFSQERGEIYKYLNTTGSHALFKSVATNFTYPVCVETRVRLGYDFTVGEGSTPSFALGWDSNWYTLGYQTFHGRFGGVDYWYIQKANTGEWSRTAEAIAADTYYRMKLAISATTQKFYVDGNLKGSLTTTPPVSQTSIMVYTGRVAGADFTTYFDWIFARKYTDPEPTHGAWGSEETPIVNNPYYYQELLRRRAA